MVDARIPGPIGLHGETLPSDRNLGPEQVPGPLFAAAVSKKVTVKITLSSLVACPGHPFLMMAEGSPSGGSYQWSVTKGNAKLVTADGLAGAAATSGPTTYLLGFKPGSSIELPKQTVHVKVTYTHPNGTRSSSKVVTIHGIRFNVTNPQTVTGPTIVFEGSKGVVLDNTRTDTMSLSAVVQILLDKCPNSVACAQRYRVGWLQTIFSNQRFVQYRHSGTAMRLIDLPIGDQALNSTPPFYGVAQAYTFDKQSLTATLKDTPNGPLPNKDKSVKVTARLNSWLTAPVAPHPVNDLRRLTLKNEFTAWLVAQNTEWASRDEPGSFVFLRHVNWSVDCVVSVDITKPVKNRCTPRSIPPEGGAFKMGKGDETPRTDRLLANADWIEVEMPGI